VQATPPPSPEVRPQRQGEALILEADGQARAQHRRARRVAINSNQLPRLRLLGFVTLSLALLVHHWLMSPQQTLVPWLVFTVCSLGYALVAWWVLARFYDRSARVDLGVLTLAVDIPMFTWALWVSGGHRSWLGFLLLVRVADQTSTTVRRVLAFLHLSLVCYGIMLLLQALFESPAPDLRVEAAKLTGLYALGLYLASTTRVAERIRRQADRAMRFADDTARDLRVQAVELRQARVGADAVAQAKVDLLANIGNELRTPVVSMLWHTGLSLGADHLPAEVRANLLLVRESGQSLLRLVDHVLQLAADGPIQHQRDFDVQGLLSDVVASQASTASAKGLRLEMEVDSMVPPVLRGEPGCIEQILDNLADNAVKFTERGSILVTAAVLSRSATHIQLEMTVLDTGIGIADGKRELIFEAFGQADTAQSGILGGAGLGLAVSRRLARALGGDLKIESTVGKGTAARLTMPLQLGRGDSPAS
jgi:signal transduction histidine kinase